MIKLSAAEIAGKIAAGEVSAVEVAQAHLDRIAQVDSSVRAFLHVDAEGALAAAKAVDDKRAAGEALSPLAGVPLAMKDVVVTEGLPTTAGSKILEGWRPPYDATITTRIKDAGHRHARQDEHGRVRDGLAPPRTRRTTRRTTRGTSPASRAARRAGQSPPSPPSRRRWRSAPTRVARSASRPR